MKKLFVHDSHRRLFHLTLHNNPLLQKCPQNLNNKEQSTVTVLRETWRRAHTHTLLLGKYYRWFLPSCWEDWERWCKARNSQANSACMPGWHQITRPTLQQVIALGLITMFAYDISNNMNCSIFLSESHVMPYFSCTWGFQRHRISKWSMYRCHVLQDWMSYNHLLLLHIKDVA